MTTYSSNCTAHLASTVVNVSAAAVLIITLSSLAGPSMASDRANLAIDQCIEAASAEYGVDKSKARFWQMNQVGRYMRVWLKLNSEEDGRIKTLCKIHKRGDKAVEIKTLNRQHD